MSYQFTTIIKKEGKWYVARCIELGVVSQGRTIEEAQNNLREAVELYMEDDDGIFIPINHGITLTEQFING
mgnify:CR=1 FL=1